MTTQRLTPRMAAVLERIQRAGRPPFHQLTPQAARALYASAAEVLDLPRAALPRVEDIALLGAGGTPLPARLYAPRLPLAPGLEGIKGIEASEALSSRTPSSHTLPVLLYFHGGGFVVGGLETHDSLCRQLALRSGGAVVALDYRLAPEHRFPAAWDDAWAALCDLRHRAPSLGLDPGRVAVGGDSAGGTLAAATALRARDEALRLVHQLLITPGMGDRTETGSRRQFAKGFLIDSETVSWFFDHLLGPAESAHRHDWRFAPLEVDEVDGVSPATLLLAECDPVVDDGIAYADRLRMAGVPVDLEIFRGVTHDFMKMGRVLPEAALAMDAAARALRQAWDAA